MMSLVDLCVSSLRRGHANLCIVPFLSDDRRSEMVSLGFRLRGPSPLAQRLQVQCLRATAPGGSRAGAAPPRVRPGWAVGLGFQAFEGSERGRYRDGVNSRTKVRGGRRKGRAPAGFEASSCQQCLLDTGYLDFIILAADEH